MLPSITNPVYPPGAYPFARISSKIRPRLSDYCGIDPAFIYPVANENYDVTIDEDFFLYFQLFGIDAFGDSGGGRLNPWATRRLRVYVYTRSGVDSYGTDEVALQGVYSDPEPEDETPPIGHFKAEEFVIGALFNWMPLQNNNRMLLEPIHPASGSGPPLRKAENSEGLIRTNLDFEIKYLLAIDKTDPAR